MALQSSRGNKEISHCFNIESLYGLTKEKECLKGRKIGAQSLHVKCFQKKDAMKWGILPRNMMG